MNVNIEVRFPHACPDAEGRKLMFSVDLAFTEYHVRMHWYKKRLRCASFDAQP